MSKVKILSIDFDYIMWPCIKLYNDMCAGDQTPGETWDRIEFERRINNHISYDAKTLKTITSIIKNALKNNECKFHSIKEHQELIKEMDVEDSDDEYSVTNVDFHHDVYYHDDDIAKMAYFDGCTCANWVGYIYFTGKLDSYTWIEAPNSDKLPSNMDDDLSDRIHVETSTGLYDLEKKLKDKEISFDHVVLCLSPQWVPYRYHHIFEMICDLVDKEG